MNNIVIFPFLKQDQISCREQGRCGVGYIMELTGGGGGINQINSQN